MAREFGSVAEAVQDPEVRASLESLPGRFPVSSRAPMAFRGHPNRRAWKTLKMLDRKIIRDLQREGLLDAEGRLIDEDGKPLFN